MTFRLSKNFLERFFSGFFLLFFIMIFNKKIQFLMFFLSFLMLFEVFFAIKSSKNSNLKKVVLMFLSFFILLIFIFYVKKGRNLLKFIIATFFLDSSSYIGGNIIKSIQITKISPKKTLSGYIIGLVFGSIAYYKLIKTDLFFSIFLSLFGMLGDLLASYLKRILNLKNFSKIIPGHGGVLDRFDSLCLSYILYNILLSCSKNFC